MRIRYLPINIDFLIRLCQMNGLTEDSTVKIVENPLPDDVEVIRMGHDSFGNINIILQSSEFEEISEGGEIPLQPRTVFNRMYK